MLIFCVCIALCYCVFWFCLLSPYPGTFIRDASVILLCRWSPGSVSRIQMMVVFLRAWLCCCWDDLPLLPPSFALGVNEINVHLGAAQTQPLVSDQEFQCLSSRVSSPLDKPICWGLAAAPSCLVLCAPNQPCSGCLVFQKMDFATPPSNT